MSDGIVRNHISKSPMDFDPKKDARTRAMISVPANHVPLVRVQFAIEDGVDKDIMFHSWGGIGDQICSEPALRYALKNFTKCRISLATDRPELFQHLPFERIYDTMNADPAWDYYLYLPVMRLIETSNLSWQFLSHLTTHCVTIPPSAPIV